MPNNRLILIRSIARRLNGRVANVGRAMRALDPKARIARPTLDALGFGQVR